MPISLSEWIRVEYRERYGAKLAQAEVFAVGIAPRIFTKLARINDTIIKKYPKNT